MIVIEKEIEGFSNYIIHSDGTIYNKKGKSICRWKDNVGYLQVKIIKDGKWHYKRVHRLVAEAFLPNPNNLLQVNHIDGDKTNNDISNLEWIDNKNNTQHGYDNNLYHSKHRCIKIEVYTLDDEYITEFKSIRETAKKLNLNRKTLSRILFDNKINNYEYHFKAVC